MGRVTIPKTPGLLPSLRWVKPSPRVSAVLLASRARSGNLVPKSRGHRASVGLLLWGLILDTVGYRVQGLLKLLLPDIGQAWGLAGPKEGSGLLICSLGLQVVGLWFS